MTNLMRTVATVWLLGLWLSGPLWAQKAKSTLSGYIKDEATGETLIGATVYFPELEVGGVSNVYGFYSVTVPAGTHKVSFSFTGYEKAELEVDLQSDMTKNVDLAEVSEELSTVQVTGVAEDANVTALEMSTVSLDMKTMTRMPALAGEVDIIRNIQLLPGVSTVGEGASGFNVRGGGVGENLVLLDEAPVYNSAHLFGFFSVFNPDAVKDVKLVKGGVPAQYGGRTSSILDVRMKEGSDRKFTATGGVGLIFSRLTVEIPVVKNKGSVVLAGRRSYADILAGPFLNEDLRGTDFYFYDLTAKANYMLSKNDKIFVSGYFGRDVFAAEEFGFKWGNATATARWNHLFSPKLFSNLTAYYSNYDYSLRFADGDTDAFNWESRIINYGLKAEFGWFANSKNEVTYGGQALYFEFEPGSTSGLSDGEAIVSALPPKYAIESALFISNKQTINDRLSLEYGLRFSHFNYIGQGRAYEFLPAETPGERRFPDLTQTQEYDDWESIQTYANWEPRFAAKYQLNRSSSLKASYNRMAQYIHLVSNTTASTPLDVWTPSTNNIEPTVADQVALGYFRNFRSNTYEFSVEGYYKDYQNVVEYVDGADLLLNEFLEGDLVAGDGRAYGMEFYFKKKTGKFNGWVSYTIARSERQVDGINKGDWFPTRFDQAHNLKTVLFYDLNKRWQFSANFVFTTGTPATFPTDRMEVQGYIIPHNANNSRNNVRIPAYHRLDLAATLQGKRNEERRWQSYWVFSVYNVYGRRNPFSIYFQGNAQNPVQTEAIRYSIIGSLVPSVSYNFQF